jgi:hypothetical protein
LGSPYVDFGFAFIMQFVNHNKKTQEMKCYGPDAEIPLWNILKFGLAQKDKLFEMVEGIP